jgi:hypothetical protein
LLILDRSRVTAGLACMIADGTELISGCWRPRAALLRRRSAGSNTAGDHLRILGEATTPLPPCGRRLMVTAGEPGDGHGVVNRPDKLASGRDLR